MKSLWENEEAAKFVGDLAQRVYTSRLLGRDRSLVLNGGGNTSVKVRETSLYGEEEEILYIKGSGWDLETISETGFSPVRREQILRLLELDGLSDAGMLAAFRSSMTNPFAPMPSVEAILHAILPAKFVDHTHADALISVMNTANGLERVEEIYGDQVVIIPYVMPGARLARLCAELFPLRATSRTVGMVLMNHGLFTFGDMARASYERMIDLVSQAEEYLQRNRAWGVQFPSANVSNPVLRFHIAALRGEVSAAARFPLIMTTRSEVPCLDFAQRSDVADVSQRGAATPDHVIRTKRVPQVGRDVAAYCRDYERYFTTYSTEKTLTMVDPAPRVILDQEMGLCAIGRTVGEAIVAGDIYRHTIDMILRAEALGGWRALAAEHMFEMEYWAPQQAKLLRSATPAMFTGEVVLVTGAASGIGKACLESMLSRGAAAIGLDINPNIKTLNDRPDFLGIACDVRDEDQVRAALEEGVRAFGGLDMLVLNAGIFPSGCPIAEIESGLWRKVMSINLDANLTFLRECYPLLKLAPRGGRVVVVGSKNVHAPGPGAAAYSASKAAMNQLARVAALEWGADRIRINSIHPNQVFDTALWTPEILESRARHYGLTVEAYKTNNILKAEIGSADVGELAAEMCGPRFAKTTGAQVPVDGGNDRVI